jgi:ribonuclease BN (tRNA processing enzyme)
MPSLVLAGGHAPLQALTMLALAGGAAGAVVAAACASGSAFARIIGSTPLPPTRSRAGTCIMVEFGNGKRFFFDFGNGALKNLVAMQVPIQMINDAFLTHLHVGHYAELPYLHAFAQGCGHAGNGGQPAGKDQSVAGPTVR